MMPLTPAEMVITAIYVFGLLGNTAALIILHKSAKTRNAKHVLMLRSLIINDLIAEMGMLTVFYLKKLENDVPVPVRYRCVLYVLMRAFGLGSGCIAFVMALERWLALTRPFLYQQIVTYQYLKRFIFALWSLSAVFSYMPLFGFGLYYKDERCCRYRDATERIDIIYAYVFMVFGTTLCSCIAWCNITVICEVARIGKQKKLLVRRVSRSIISNRGCNNYATREELAFAKMMAVLCIIFILCWMPQMIMIPMAQFLPTAKAHAILGRLTDLLMCVYLALDPYVYVVYRYLEKGGLFHPCNSRSSRSSSNMSTPPTAVGTPTSILMQPPSYADTAAT